MAILEIKNLSKSFGAEPVLKQVNLSVERQQVVSVIGPSGTGKSTLLRCINFLERADQGTIEIDGVFVDCASASEGMMLNLTRQTAMVFQNYNLFKNKNVLDNVASALRYVKKVDKRTAEERALAELERVGMLEKWNAYPMELSGGQQQRVAIARTLALDPKVLLMDEPTSALDTELTREVLTIIGEVAQLGITMLVVTHEIEFARGISDRIIFMEKGLIVEDGTPEQVFCSPRSERTKQFLRNYSV